MTSKKKLKKIMAILMVAVLMIASNITVLASETEASETQVTPKATWYIIGSGSAFFSGSSATIEVNVSRTVTNGKIHFTVEDPGNSASNWTWQMKEPGSSTYKTVNVLSIGNGVLAEVGASVKAGTYVFKLSSPYASGSTEKEAYVNVSGYW